MDMDSITEHVLCCSQVHGSLSHLFSLKVLAPSNQLQENLTTDLEDGCFTQLCEKVSNVSV